MKKTLALLLLLVALQGCVTRAPPRRLQTRVTPNLKRTYAEWQKIMASQKLRPENNPVYKGTKPQPENAGVVSKEIQSRIIQGQMATRGQLPWQAAIVVDDGFYCGGSLISNKWVITAAHCTTMYDTFTIVLGATTLFFNESGVVSLQTRTVITHPDYNAQIYANDLAVLSLPNEVTFSTYINAVRLPSASEVSDTFEGDTALVSGWGYADAYDYDPSNYLNYLSVTVDSNTHCASEYADYINSTKLCTVGTGGQSLCYGDTGGPLVFLESDGRYTMIGVVSFGSSDCDPTLPAAYSRVTAYLSWISSATDIAISE